MQAVDPKKHKQAMERRKKGAKKPSRPTTKIVTGKQVGGKRLPTMEEVLAAQRAKKKKGPAPATGKKKKF